LKFAELAGLVEPSVARDLQRIEGARCSRTAKRARALREHLFAVLAAAHAGKPLPKPALLAISTEVRQAHAARGLVASKPSGVVGHGWLSERLPELPLYACALAVENLLIGADRSRLRKCGASDCAVYFLDTSKANRRQWCSMANCGNREKQRRWRMIGE
jgi:predicted RNA-binding Zn ribbon-like protein